MEFVNNLKTYKLKNKLSRGRSSYLHSLPDRPKNSIDILQIFSNWFSEFGNHFTAYQIKNMVED